LGVINRVKALFAGRRGQPLLQAYFDIAKLLRKGAVYSTTTTWVFRASPIVGILAVASALLFIPYGSIPSVLAFVGDWIALFYMMGLARFFMIAAALDTGSAFEGMGASREALFSALAEPALFIGLAALVRMRDAKDMGSLFSPHTEGLVGILGPHGGVYALVGAAFFLILLSENSRLPVDDPNTHLELTMIHEVMVLDHSGPDFGLIEYASALKMWLFCALTLHAFYPGLDAVGFTAGVFGIAVLVGVVESVLARVKMNRVTQYLAGAGVLNVVALILALRG
jgi:formate hydrogenlyase subunit 4